MANPVGRPSKYKKKFCQMLIDHCGQGLSFESFAGLIDVNQDTLHEWCKRHPEFSEAKKRASEKRRLTLEKIGMNGMMGKIENFNSTAYVWFTKNTIGWRDKQEIISINQNVNSEVNIKEMVKNPELLKDLIQIENRFRKIRDGQ